MDRGENESHTFPELLKAYPRTLVYFYPKDDTPWCTLENKEFTQYQQDFAQKGIGLLGISKDSIASHCSFRDQYGLTVRLLSDPNLELHEHYGAFWEKNNYGKIIKGVIRSTYLVDQEGKVLKAYPNVKATWHVARLLEEVKSE